jgi:hypothetical protein
MNRIVEGDWNEQSPGILCLFQRLSFSLSSFILLSLILILILAHVISLEGGQTNGVALGLIREITNDETIVLLISRNGGELASMSLFTISISLLLSLHFIV